MRRMRHSPFIPALLAKKMRWHLQCTNTRAMVRVACWRYHRRVVQAKNNRTKKKDSTIVIPTVGVRQPVCLASPAASAFIFFFLVHLPISNRIHSCVRQVYKLAITYICTTNKRHNRKSPFYCTKVFRLFPSFKRQNREKKSTFFCFVILHIGLRHRFVYTIIPIAFSLIIGRFYFRNQWGRLDNVEC